MTSAYIRLAGPLQSWAQARVTGNVVRTGPRPTRSAIEGLLAGALGHHRGEWPDWLSHVDISVRTDRPGVMIDEYQTINPRPEDQHFQKRLLQMLGNRPSKVVSFTPDGQSKTSIVRRTYLADAEFIVQIRDDDHLTLLCSALANPVFSPYLGRKAFPPTFPFYLGRGRDDLLRTLPPRTTDANRVASLRIDQLLSDSSGKWELTNPATLEGEDWYAEVRSRLRRA